MTDGPEDEFESRIIGDSIVRSMISEFCSRCPEKRKRFCIPETRLNDITAARDDVTQDGDRNTLYIIHAGTNDIQYSNPDELLAKYKLMIQRFKMKTDRLVISGNLVPSVHDCTYSRLGTDHKAFANNSYEHFPTVNSL